MARPLQEVQVYSIQLRRGQDRVKRPYVVRYAIDGRQRSRSFRTRGEADRYRSELLRAAHAGHRFDLATGEPEAWVAPMGELRIHEWVRRWVGEQWSEWQPRTRSSALEALSRFVAASTTVGGRAPDRVRKYLRHALAPGAAQNEAYERWLSKHCPRLEELDRVTTAAIAAALALTLTGEPLAASTANRFRTTAHACVLAAVDAGALSEDPWPRRSRTRGNRKVARRRRGVEVDALPDPLTMAAAIEAVVTRRHGSRVYRVMTAVAYYAGLRPSEVVMLRVRSLHLPDAGWGKIVVTEADIAWDEPGEPKTGPRRVPIPPVLVEILRLWLVEIGASDPDQLIFRTERGTRPSTSNWGRAWRRALASIGHPPLRVYDCRHAAATTWLRAGVPLGEVARPG